MHGGGWMGAARDCSAPWRRGFAGAPQVELRDLKHGRRRPFPQHAPSQGLADRRGHVRKQRALALMPMQAMQGYTSRVRRSTKLGSSGRCCPQGRDAAPDVRGCDEPDPRTPLPDRVGTGRRRLSRHVTRDGTSPDSSRPWYGAPEPLAQRAERWKARLLDSARLCGLARRRSPRSGR